MGMHRESLHRAHFDELARQSAERAVYTAAAIRKVSLWRRIVRSFQK
jgi:hypothetical protein